MHQNPHKGKGEPDQLARPLSLPQFVPVGDVARRLGLSVKTIRRWADEGLHGCPGKHDLGEKSAVMRLDEVLDWIESRRVTRPAPAPAEGDLDARQDDAARATGVA